MQGWGRVGEEAGVLCSVLSGQGLGGGQGWRDAQWETVLQLVANLITPESLFRPLVITHPPPPFPSPPAETISNPTSSSPLLILLPHLPHFGENALQQNWQLNLRSRSIVSGMKQ